MPTEEELDILAQQCDIEAYRSGGPGGQHRNKVETAVRVTHRSSGIVCLGRSQRSQFQNKIEALTRLWNKLQEMKKKKKRRIPTQPSFGSKQRHFEIKHRQSEKKSERRWKPNAE